MSEKIRGREEGEIQRLTVEARRIYEKDGSSDDVGHEIDHIKTQLKEQGLTMKDLALSEHEIEVLDGIWTAWITP